MSNVQNPRKKYGHLPFKEIEDNHWDTVCVDFIGSFTPTDKYDKVPFTMYDPATDWFGIAEICD
jgi:hypothetical protein